MVKTAEEIAKATQSRTGRAARRAINKLYREQDESAIWPINGQFNVTERALRQVSKFERSYGSLSGIEYCHVLERFMRNIINKPDPDSRNQKYIHICH